MRMMIEALLVQQQKYFFIVVVVSKSLNECEESPDTITLAAALHIYIYSTNIYKALSNATSSSLTSSS
jgi:hypothetical protein